MEAPGERRVVTSLQIAVLQGDHDSKQRQETGGASGQRALGASNSYSDHVQGTGSGVSHSSPQDLIRRLCARLTGSRITLTRVYSILLFDWVDDESVCCHGADECISKRAFAMRAVGRYEDAARLEDLSEQLVQRPNDIDISLPHSNSGINYSNTSLALQLLLLSSNNQALHKAHTAAILPRISPPEHTLSSRQHLLLPSERKNHLSVHSVRTGHDSVLLPISKQPSEDIQHYYGDWACMRMDRRLYSMFSDATFEGLAVPEAAGSVQEVGMHTR